MVWFRCCHYRVVFSAHSSQETGLLHVTLCWWSLWNEWIVDPDAQVFLHSFSSVESATSFIAVQLECTYYGSALIAGLGAIRQDYMSVPRFMVWMPSHSLVEEETAHLQKKGANNDCVSSDSPVLKYLCSSRSSIYICSKSVKIFLLHCQYYLKIFVHFSIIRSIFYWGDCALHKWANSQKSTQTYQFSQFKSHWGLESILGSKKIHLNGGWSQSVSWPDLA